MACLTIMLTIAFETKKESHVRENSPYILAQKKGKNDSLEGGARKSWSGDGGKRVLEKRKEQEDVGHHTFMTICLLLPMRYTGRLLTNPLKRTSRWYHY